MPHIFSAVIIIVYAIIVMTMLLNVKIAQLSSGKRIFFFIGAAVIIGGQIIARYYLKSDYTKYYLLVAQLPVFLLFFFTARKGFLNTLFITLTTIFFTAPGLTCGRFFNLLVPNWVNIYPLVCLAVNVFMLWLIRRYIRDTFIYIFDTFRPIDILGFCSIPLLYNLMVLSTGGYMADGSTLLRLLIALATMTAYFLLMNIFRRSVEINNLKYERDMLQVVLDTSEQYLREQRAIEEQERIYRHDIRHHLSLIHGWALDGNTERIVNYLAEVESELNAITPARYCENDTVNLILTSFQTQAAQKGITLCIDAQLPPEIPISDTELCSLYANALENAITAAAKLSTAKLRRVYLRSFIRDSKLLISTENAYNGTIDTDGDFIRPQTAEQGHGFGLRSMAAICEAHNGLYSFETKDNVFILRLMLRLQ